MSDDLLNYLVQRVEDIDKKVDSLLKFKWQILGASAMLTVFITLGFNLATKLF